ncbi:hypothetical protein [Streptomyces sp. RKND-216]|uniref:hypothetical protein n=1 Tax=Streptomyces sp. RKND-216 TaxID=2562581 RepID=UPI001FF77E08|nr:hypothetical protein [Streptomyces sp. RKND-216]
MHRRRHASVRAAVCAPVAALLLGAAGCTGPAPSVRDTEQAVQALFDRQAAAVRDADTSRYLAAVDPRSGDYRAAQRTVAANLARLPVATWTYRVRSVRTHHERADAVVELRYRLGDRDRPPVVEKETFALRRHDGRWWITGERHGRGRQLWEQGRLRVVHGQHSLVLGTVDHGTLRRIAARADRAVPAVSAAWPDPWSRRTVVLVPASVDGMAELLDGEPATYEGIAAVTTGPRGGEPGERRRIVVNRQAYALLSDRGRQVVLTHETAHVATRDHTDDSTPLWLSEGLADWVGYRGTGADPSVAAPTLAEAVRAGDLPRRLPPDADFRFTGDPDALARAYEGSWLACRMIADRWGAGRLAAFYRAVGAADGGPAQAVDGALREVLAVDREAFIRMWHSALRAELAP